MKNPLISVQHVSVQYDDRIILNDISLDIFAGERFAILGASGCGKTTLMSQMIGLQKPDSGDVIIDGDSIVSADEKKRLAILKKMGVMYQSGALFGSMTLLENVRLPLEELTDLPLDAANIVALNKLKLVGLGNYANFMPAEISGGMKKRAAIARAMALDPKILFLDELSAGLDPITSAQLDRLVLELSQALGITFVIVTHELPSIFSIANRAILLHDKKIIGIGSPEELRHHENEMVRKFFNRE
jgi:phospholipid/cholesterol/gamma-HCH transport system ATP-binding protein